MNSSPSHATPVAAITTAEVSLCVQSLAHGIHVVDTGFHRPRFDAAYLMVEAGRAAFIDTGINDSVPHLMAALASTGLRPEDVDFVIPTHVHLDHAGGAALLMRQLPAATLVVHPRGARHMVDPTYLLAGAGAVYGTDEVMRTYGRVTGVPADRVKTSTDGMTLNLGGRPLELLHTPGHAKHHHCIWDARSRGFFTGDTFGLSYREFDTAQGAFLLPTTTPVQFEPDALKSSVQRMLAYRPERMYLTHFGAVQDVARLGHRLLEQLESMVELGLTLASESERHASLMKGLAALYLSRLRRHGCVLDDAACLALLAMDIELNAQGIGIWLDRQARTCASTLAH